MKTAQERNLLAEAAELGLTVRFSHARPAGEYVVTAPGRATLRPAAKGGETICCLMRPQHNPDSGEDELKTILVVWADADGDRLLVPLEDATRAVRDARAAARQRTVAEIVEALRVMASEFGGDGSEYPAVEEAADLIESRFGGGES